MPSQKILGEISHQKTIIRYRPEIDGLRALAVISVILFHAGVDWLPGGYVGVDVFFVISGYLITSIILTEAESHRFSIVRFYERRARRILPALFVVMAIGIPVAWWLLLPHQLLLFAHGLIAVPLFSSNFLFWRQSGYFTPTAEFNPLLHTWSLAVEEQYYVLFPVVFTYLWTRSKGKAEGVLALVALMSFAGCLYLYPRYPAANFYLPFSRAWELLAGALLATRMSRGLIHGQFFRKSRGLLAMIGLALIATSCVLMGDQTPFPSHFAIAPVFGAGLIIACAHEGNWVGRLLSSRPLVKIGLVSYSAYLWHQPLFVFMRCVYPGSPPEVAYVLLMVVTTILAYVSWRFIEQPFRTKGHISRKSIFVFAVTGSGLLVMVGAVMHLGNGFPSRLSVNQRAMQQFRVEQEARLEATLGPCFLNTKATERDFGGCDEKPAGRGATVFLWGDSEANHLLPGLEQARPAGTGLIHLTAAGCPPILGLNTREQPRCVSINKYVFSRIESIKPSTVILSARWGYYEWNKLAETLDQLKKAGISDVAVVGPVPVWNQGVPDLLTRLNLPVSELPQRYSEKYRDEFEATDRGMGALVAGHGGRYFSARSILCNAQGCRVRTGPGGLRSLLYVDATHFTPSGSVFFVQQLAARGLFH